MKIEDRRIITTSSESRVEEKSLLLVTHEPDQCIECQRLQGLFVNTFSGSRKKIM